MNATLCPVNSFNSDSVTSDHFPGVVGTTRTFQVPSPSKKPGKVNVFSSGPVTVAENSARNGLDGVALAVKLKSCGCQQGTAGGSRSAAGPVERAANQTSKM